MDAPTARRSGVSSHRTSRQHELERETASSGHGQGSLEQRRIEIELGHARKLEAVGQLASGIAHEINTPTQYVGDGVHFLKEAFDGYAAGSANTS